MDVLYIVIVTSLLSRWVDSIHRNGLDKLKGFELFSICTAIILHFIITSGIIIYNVIETAAWFFGK